MWIKIIKTKTWEAIVAEKEKMQKALSDIMAKYENLHRLYDGLWNRYKEECQARDKLIEELREKLSKAEHQRNEFKKKYETLKNKKA